ncbi:unnamed protein product [Heligmosomoides polygyrus]|uniref:Uncharacterized protein n=1 Tax=Heligmosomoides polygyrus TaxID=6339 RepID=A0A183FLI9_HELPZ|nr:unnamed protein product [Heligmosomoides polygyrus]
MFDSAVSGHGPHRSQSTSWVSPRPRKPESRRGIGSIPGFALSPTLPHAVYSCMLDYSSHPSVAREIHLFWVRVPPHDRAAFDAERVHPISGASSSMATH